MSLVLYGVSEELIAAFEGLRESPGISGPKYRHKDIDALAQMILCRNYGKATLELSYLLLAVALREPGDTQQAWLKFFWLQEAITPRRFRATFDEIPEYALPHLSLADEGLKLKISDQKFTLSPTRISVLASLLEFIVHIDPSVLKQDEAFYAQPNLTSVKTLASKFQALIYDYLSDHLLAAQQQRRFRHLWDWLSRRDKDNPEVDDAAVLEFWQQTAQSSDDQLGFRRYRTVAENFIDLRLAMQCVNTQQQVAGAKSIGYEAETGEISPELLQQLLETDASQELNPVSLTQTPKFLTKQQAQSCTAFVQSGTTASALPLTLMRMQCFGDWQAALVQALRSKNAKHLTSLLAGNSDSYKSETYTGYVTQHKALQETLTLAWQSGLHVLLHYKVPEVMGLLLPQLSTATISDLHELIQADVEAIDASNLDHITNTLFQHWSTMLLQLPELNDLVHQLQSAFKSNNRQGFKQLPEPLNYQPYLDGVQMIDGIGQRCTNHLQAVATQLAESNTNEPEEHKYASDLSIFQGVFNVLYGERL
ncbi:MAG: hypothetical protein COA99_11420 [Moraxellaceae bacterium]|nr:MAG: hypothetical protein COA99_11420 [Moraxellaceae bacterium]